MNDKQKLSARDKKIQHMSRDGLVEENLTQGTSQSISSRTQYVMLENKNSV